MKNCRILFLLLAVLLLNEQVVGRTQSVAVQGTLTCDGKPAAGVKVKLYDVNRIPPDTKLDESKTDSKGIFHLQGSKSSSFQIKPKLNVYHKCHYNAPLPICYQKFSIKIPSDYITVGPVPDKTFKAGSLNLEAKYPGQGRDCTNLKFEFSNFSTIANEN